MNFKFLSIFTLLAIILTSCSNDDDNNLVSEAPVISDFEYGEGSSHGSDAVGYIGSDIHVEAEIYAEATVSSITLAIHSHEVTVGEGEEEWDFEQTFTDSKYRVINPTFHEHIDIPDTAPVGEYHVILTVTDNEGNTTEIEGEVELIDAITMSDISIDSEAARGDDMHAEFMIAAVNGIHSITIAIHAHDITPGAGELEWDYEEVFEEGYHDETEVEFHEHIDIPASAPAGEYHLSITIEDEDGNILEYENHIDITA
ncbi:DUF4625 domain-containing protein [Robertkochia solimangrovi]|uniref:DUF4625 domain-containing protein n=1 Tax=Robertkochia solimangrovi TaxID=2213046 RepID=UPI001180AE98|nr:DUF4625 domain-containing protein [Robertkochia solimangrovi]TRZ42863.1 protein containing PKD domain-containing protein [Robertkochia solimangrovi]